MRHYYKYEKCSEISRNTLRYYEHCARYQLNFLVALVLNYESQRHEGAKYHSSVCIFRRSTRLATTKAPVSCRSPSSRTRRSIRTPIEEDVGKSHEKRRQSPNWSDSSISNRKPREFAAPALSSSSKPDRDHGGTQLSPLSAFFPARTIQEEEENLRARGSSSAGSPGGHFGTAPGR